MQTVVTADGQVMHLDREPDHCMETMVNGNIQLFTPETYVMKLNPYIETVVTADRRVM